MVNEKAIEKIKKLLTKADSNKNDSECEVESAALMAQRLMAKYDIDISEIELKEIQEIVHGELDITKHRSWKFRLANVIADNFRCKVYAEREGRPLKRFLRFVGHKSDVAIANEMYTFLYKIGNRNATKLEKRIREEQGTAKGVYMSYVEGFVLGLKEKLEAQCRVLMVVVPPDVEDEFNKTVSGITGKGLSSRTTKKYDGQAYAQGRYDGKNSINRTELK